MNPVILMSGEVIVPWGMIVIGAGIFIGMFGELLKRRKAVQWPKTTALVSRSEIRKEKGNKGILLFFALVEFEYEVDGKEYLSVDKNIGSAGLSDESFVRNRLKDYSVGKEIEIFYDPTNPSECMKEVGVQWYSYFGLLIPISFIIGGILILRG